MSEKQITGDITPKASKPVPTEANVNVEGAVIRTMQKDIDSLRDRVFAKSPQNLPVAEKSAKEMEEKAELQRKLAEKNRKKEEERKIKEEQRIAKERENAERRRKAEEQKIIEEQRKKEEQAKKKAVREQKRKLRALKIIAFKAWLKANPQALIKFSIIAAAVILILGGASGFLYWWNYLRTATLPVAVTHYQCQDFQCLSVEGEGVDQCQIEQDCQPAEPKIPQSLIPVNKTELIEIKAGHSELFVQALKFILEKDREENALDNILIKTVSRTERKYIDLSHFLSLLGFSLPEKIIQSAVKDELGGANYTFFLYNQTEGKRLGFAIQIIEGVDLSDEFQEWEANILKDINALFVNLNSKALSAAVEEFQDNIYNGIAIRYLNFPNPDLSIDYAVVEDKLIVATSKESMYAVIDALLPLKAETASDSETDNPIEQTAQ